MGETMGVTFHRDVVMTLLQGLYSQVLVMDHGGFT